MVAASAASHNKTQCIDEEKEEEEGEKRGPSKRLGEVVAVTSLLLKCCFTSTETVGLLGTGAQDDHLDFHAPPEL